MKQTKIRCPKCGKDDLSVLNYQYLQCKECRFEFMNFEEINDDSDKIIDKLVNFEIRLTKLEKKLDIFMKNKKKEILLELMNEINTKCADEE